MISFSRANKIFKYDPVTGKITNRTSRKGTKKGYNAGSRSNNAWYVSVDGFRYRIIDIVYLLYRGEFSRKRLYYKDRDTSNHKWGNLTTKTPDRNLPKGTEKVLGKRQLITMGKSAAIVIFQDKNITHVHSIKHTKTSRVYIKISCLNPLVHVNTEELYKFYKKDGFVKIVC